MSKMIIGVSALLGLIAAPALAADLAPRTYTKAPPIAPVAAVYDCGWVRLGPFGSDRSWNCATPAATTTTTTTASAASAASSK